MYIRLCGSKMPLFRLVLDGPIRLVALELFDSWDMLMNSLS